MACSIFACKSLRRGKYFVPLFLLLSVLAWLAALSGESVKTFQVHLGPTGKSLRVELDSQLETSSQTTTTEDCPAQSPLLVGPLQLTFDSSLIQEDVEKENQVVVDGTYKPPDCTSRQNIAILIPHRNREKHLLFLLHYLHPFLQRQQLHYGIYVIHQAGDTKFNRAKLLNVGFLEAQKDYDWDCFFFHDVDLIPENDHNLYMCENNPKHLVVGRNVTGYKLRYKGYFGGVTAMNSRQFLQVNGFSNNYWGWGGEDDDLRIRTEIHNMTIVRPPADVARYTMVFHSRDSGNEVNKQRLVLVRSTKRLWKKDGLSSCKYQVLSLDRLPLYVNITVDIGKPFN